MFRLDGVYLKGSTNKREKRGILTVVRWDEYIHSYILFFENPNSKLVELYHGAFGGDVARWMKAFACWTELGHRQAKVNSYTIKNDNVYYEANNRKFKLNFIDSGNMLLLNVKNLENNETTNS